MPEETTRGDGCAEFDALLSDALDTDFRDNEGRLSSARKDNIKESFEAHRRVCSICGPLFADVQAGQQWLRSLEPVEPPVHLVHNILAATSGVVSTRPLTAADGPGWPQGVASARRRLAARRRRGVQCYRCNGPHPADHARRRTGDGAGVEGNSLPGGTARRSGGGGDLLCCR